MAGYEIYGLIDPRNGELRYIGKARNSETRLNGHLRDVNRRKTPVYIWLRALLEAGQYPMLSVLERCEDWIEAERRLIKEARDNGTKLLNVAPGGNEPYCSAEIRAANGRRNAEIMVRRRTETPFKAEAYRLKKYFGTALAKGEVPERIKEKLRYCARKRPELFGCFAGI